MTASPQSFSQKSFSRAFMQAIAIVVGANEGAALDLSYGDTGNWTGGRAGAGVLRGSRFGISAASYPDLDIGALTYDAALAIYWRDFWTPCECDSWPPALALLVVDAAINNGPHRAIPWLQAAVGAVADGRIGPRTRAAVAACRVDAAAIEFMAQRIEFEPGTGVWLDDARGMARRLARLPYQARQMETPPGVVA